ncbi:MAG TPA: ABC transporter permease [Anaerolineales bacterium]|nr:ABC transporter permease [Anaerolineales bacterium]
MMRNFMSSLRLYLASAWYSYRSVYAWQQFGPYISVKIAFPLAQMLLFYFMGRLAGLKDPIYIVIGNILLLPSTNGISGVSQTISHERDFKTLPYLIASPAERGPLFLGRSLVHILDGLVSTLMALVLGAVFFHVDLTHSNLPLTILCILLLSVTSCGMGLILGSLSLRTREAWTVTSMVVIALYIFSGVNFPVEVLPRSLQVISYSLPLTRGIQAARLAMNGAGWAAIQSLFLGELLIGILYIGIGYLALTWFEKLSLVDGQIETI